MNRSIRRRLSSLALIASIALCGYVHADPCKPYTSVDFWAEEEDIIVGLDVAFSNCLSEFSNLRLGLSYFAHEDFVYEGITGSFRLQHGNTVSPFIGIGTLVGIAEKSVPATDDGIDNNGDGFIDEPGETVTQRKGNAFLYPEAGVAVYINGIGASLSARRYFGENFSGNIIHSLGISIKIP